MKLTQLLPVAILVFKTFILFGSTASGMELTDSTNSKKFPLFVWASIGAGAYLDNQAAFTDRFNYTQFNHFEQFQLSARYKNVGLAYLYAQRQIYSAGKECSSIENMLVGFYHYQYARFHFQAELGFGKANFCYNQPNFIDPQPPTVYVSNVAVVYYGTQIMYSFSPYFGIYLKCQGQLNRISAQRGLHVGLAAGLIRSKRKS